jgi:hypothetical protein
MRMELISPPLRSPVVKAMTYLDYCNSRMVGTEVIANRSSRIQTSIAAAKQRSTAPSKPPSYAD